MKRFVVIFLLMVMATNVKAQEDFIIPALGGNFSGMVFGNDRYDLKSHSMMKGGFVGGVRYQHQFRKPYIIETALTYNESGYILNNLEELESLLEYPLDKINFKFNYVSVPLMFGYRFGRSDRSFSVAPKIGVQFGYLASSKMKYVYNCVDYKDVFDTKNKFDFAEVCEVEFSWVWGERVRSFLSVAQRYSFTNLNSGDEDLIDMGDVKMHNIQFSVNVGLRIKVNKMQKSLFD